MASLAGFDANNVDPDFGFEPIPNGDYRMAIVASEKKRTKANDGSYIALTLEVLEGQYKGKKVFTNLNLENKNATAVKIAQAELSAICHAAGKMRPNDTIELHNIPMICTVKCSKRKDTDELQNSVAKYRNVREASEAVAVGSESSEKAPWE